MSDLWLSSRRMWVYEYHCPDVSLNVLADVIYQVYMVQLSGLDASLLFTWHQCRKPAIVTQVAYQHSIRQNNLVSQVGSRNILITRAFCSKRNVKKTKQHS